MLLFESVVSASGRDQVAVGIAPESVDLSCRRSGSVKRMLDLARSNGVLAGKSSAAKTARC